MPARSNVRLDVSIEKPVVFAGECVNAIITFRNATPAHAHQRSEESAVTSPTAGNHQRQISSVTFSTPWLGDNDSTSTLGNSGPRESTPTAAAGSSESSQHHSPTPSGASLSRSASLRVDTGNGRAANLDRPSSRTSFSMARPRINTSAQALLMGFAQVQGYFEVDSSIVDPEPFEHVRTQGVVIGQQGGLGYRRNSSGGMLRGLAAGIGNLLKDKPPTALDDGSQVPLFSTPQSLLFVDLKLAPGESRSYSYSLKLPQSLPPSSRGKAIKIQYDLVIGTQMLDARGKPQHRVVHAPFRVFPHVSFEGHLPIHDLMQPVVMQTDEAVVSSVYGRDSSPTSAVSLKSENLPIKDPGSPQGKEEFINYVQGLLDRSASVSSIPSVSSESGTAYDPNKLRKESALTIAPEDGSCRSNIEYFLRFLPDDRNTLHRSKFEIGRGGHKIASASLSRPAYRVGEDVVILLDFSDAALSCYHVTASLETTEKLDASITDKTPAEQLSMTRRVYAQLTSSSFSDAKAHFDFTIPSTATPKFDTSVSSLSWSLKLDFITSAHPHQTDLQRFHSDENGTILVPPTSMECESVSCRIPLNVLPTNHDLGTLLDYTPSFRRWAL
uniref:ARAD1D21274p n=1 Tax=Blastobotrys adeninivorans TaxID=409370 RepID=A0A060T9T0_BLAAD